MAYTQLTISQARKTIFSQEVPLPIRRSAWKLFRHEIERIDPKTKRAPTPKRALERVIAWMIVQSEREAKSNFKLSTIQKRLLYLIVVEGFTQNQAALELDRSRETVKKYCINLKKQLGVDSFYQVVAIAVYKGWIPAPFPERYP